MKINPTGESRMLRKNRFNNKKIIVGVSGGIAAYKIPHLVRLLKKEGAEVQILMTESAKNFVTPQTLSVLSERPVLIDFFQNNQGEWNNHIDLGLWADAILIAPAGANTLAKMTHGICDNLLLSVILSARCPVWIAPAMDLDMWAHASTQENIETLQKRNIRLIEPTEGLLASGLEGKGRMAEPEAILNTLLHDLLPPDNYFSGKKVLVTAGGTRESIDPVRFIGNHSSGKMGFAIAEALIACGAEVSLVYGSVSEKLPTNCLHYPVVSAEEMFETCKRLFADSSILIMSAAVADYQVQTISSQKIKKTDAAFSLELIKTPDILRLLSIHKTPQQICIGFALETENEQANALVKLKNKNLDCIVLNSLNNPHVGFGKECHEVDVFCKDGDTWNIPAQNKTILAETLINTLSVWLLK